jgi:2-oxoglutarate ferredoxin oxidoreductase subunit delta
LKLQNFVCQAGNPVSKGERRNEASGRWFPGVFFTEKSSSLDWMKGGKIVQKVVVNEERCKGCGLCTAACPKGIMKLSEKINAAGYHPAMCIDQDACISCAMCAMNCPDVAIEVYK